MRYERVLIKLSGGAFSGAAESGIERSAVDALVDEIKSLAELGVEVAIMVGGGNIFRGRLADDWGIERAEADNIGMMSTVVNSLILRGALTSHGSQEVRVMTAIPIASVAEPYIRLRAIKHLEKGYIVVFAAGIGQPFVTTDYPAVQRAIEVRADAIFAAKQGVNGVFAEDPKRNPDAKRYEQITYDDVVDKGLKVMDQSAFILARDHRIPIHVFDASERNAMRNIAVGEPTGTYVGPDAVTVFSAV
ncbi:MAG: UMP kinase [Chloroflexota bacterium]|nr:UMP kinase [Chloroflexia bacterium]MDQ3444480.1 UMP kinase [Chloroflexota bacterium]